MIGADRGHGPLHRHIGAAIAALPDLAGQKDVADPTLAEMIEKRCESRLYEASRGLRHAARCRWCNSAGGDPFTL